MFFFLGSYINDYIDSGDYGLIKPKVTTSAVLIASQREEDCAVSCSTQTKFQCRSFDMCFDNVNTLKYNCFLHTTHYLDNNQLEKVKLNLNQTTHCGHYSRNYVTDYKTYENTKLKNSDDLVKIASIPLEQCAKRCSETKSGGCLSYMFCTNQKLQPIGTKTGTICYFSSKSYGSSSSTIPNSVTDNNCAVYSKVSANNVMKPNTATINQVTRSYSSGSSAGVGILMIFVGAVLSVALIIGYQRREQIIGTVIRH